MSDIFEAKQRLLNELQWAENPFVKDLRAPEKAVFMKYYCPFEASQMLQKMAFDTKACLLLGPKGVGKTSALQFVSYNLPSDEFLPILFKEPPENMSDLASLLPSRGFFEKFFSFIGGKSVVPREEIVKRLKSEKRKIVFFMDEAHLEKNPSMYMEFKYLLDEVPNLRIIISALGKENFPDSLLQLVGTPNIFQRRGFSEEEMLQIISHRISAVGGRGLEPFKEDFLKNILTEQNLLSPRYVFDELNNYLAQMALGKASDENSVEEKTEVVQSNGSVQVEKAVLTTSNADWWVVLSPSQQQIMNLLLKTEGLTLSAIMERTGLSQNTAFNALYQLRGDDDAEVKRKPDVPFPLVVVKQKMVGGRKKNIYQVDSKIKHLFTLH